MAKEMQSRKWFWFAIVSQNVFAYAVTLVIYQIGSFLLYGTFSAWTVIAFAVLLFMLFMLFRPDPTKIRRPTPRDLYRLLHKQSEFIFEIYIEIEFCSSGFHRPGLC